MFAEALLQLPPHQGEALVEGLATGVGGQQAGLGADVARQRFDLGPGLGRGVQVGDGFEVTVQVQHHVGIAGQPLQGEVTFSRGY